MRHIIIIISILCFQACTSIPEDKGVKQNAQQSQHIEQAKSYISSGDYSAAKAALVEAIENQDFNLWSRATIENAIEQINFHQTAIKESQDRGVVKLFSPRPDFPKISYQLGQDSRIRLVFTIKASGEIAHIEVVKFHSYSLDRLKLHSKEIDFYSIVKYSFEVAAINAVKEFVFLPKLVKGKAVEVKAGQEIIFK